MFDDSRQRRGELCSPVFIGYYNHVDMAGHDRIVVYSDIFIYHIQYPIFESHSGEHSSPLHFAAMGFSIRLEYAWQPSCAFSVRENQTPQDLTRSGPLFPHCSKARRARQSRLGRLQFAEGLCYNMHRADRRAGGMARVENPARGRPAAGSFRVFLRRCGAFSDKEHTGGTAFHGVDGPQRVARSISLVF